MKNFCEILGLEINADVTKIRLAFRKSLKKFHPDLNPNDKFFEKMFKEINEANEILSNPSNKLKGYYLPATFSKNSINELRGNKL